MQLYIGYPSEYIVNEIKSRTRPPTTTCIVTFLGYDDRVLKTQQVQKGQDAIPPTVEQVVVQDDDIKEFQSQWTVDYHNVQTDITTKAIYSIATDVYADSIEAYSAKFEMTDIETLTNIQ